MPKLLIERQLVIVGNSNALKEYIRIFNQSLPEFWTKIETINSGSVETHEYQDTNSDLRGLVNVLMECTANRITLKLVRPENNAEVMSTSQYNLLISNYFRNIFAPFSSKLGMICELTSDHTDLTQLISGNSANLLQRFAKNSSGVSEAFDKERWFKFVFSIHSQGERCRFPSKLLKQWLKAQTKFLDHDICNLACEYDRSLDLLERYDQKASTSQSNQ